MTRMQTVTAIGTLAASALLAATSASAQGLSDAAVDSSIKEMAGRASDNDRRHGLPTRRQNKGNERTGSEGSAGARRNKRGGRLLKRHRGDDLVKAMYDENKDKAKSKSRSSVPKGGGGGDVFLLSNVQLGAANRHHVTPLAAGGDDDDDDYYYDDDYDDDDEPRTKSGKGSSSSSSSADAPSSSGGDDDYYYDDDYDDDEPRTKSGKGPSSSSSSGGGKPSTNHPPASSPSRGKTTKAGKSRGPTPPSPDNPKICSKRLTIAFELISALGPNPTFGHITKPSEVTELCAFAPPDPFTNFGCPILFTPENGFLLGLEDYVAGLGPDAGPAAQALVSYCDCRAGLELGCAAKIPHGPASSTVERIDIATGATEELPVNGYSEFVPFGTPAGRAEYCELVGVWNGDFDAEDVTEFAPGVEECGCYFIGQAREMVAQCPGVELGAFFEFPPSPSTAPTTDVPDATFYDSFERPPFPDDPWSLSTATETNSNRKLQVAGTNWARTTDESFTGDYSIVSPDPSSIDAPQFMSSATLSLDGPGTLTFYLLSRLNLPVDALAVAVDGEIELEVTESKDKFKEYEIELESEGPHEVSWSYIYNPGDLDPSDLDDAGGAFVDEVFFVPAPAPTYSPTSFPTESPTYEPTMGFPTQVPTATQKPTTS